MNDCPVCGKPVSQESTGSNQCPQCDSNLQVFRALDVLETASKSPTRRTVIVASFFVLLLFSGAGLQTLWIQTRLERQSRQITDGIDKNTEEMSRHMQDQMQLFSERMELVQKELQEGIRNNLAGLQQRMDLQDQKLDRLNGLVIPETRPLLPETNPAGQRSGEVL